MFDKLVKTLFLTGIALTALLFTGCEEENITDAPAADQVDLSQTEDLFEQPLQANPLAASPSDVLVRVNGEEITRGDVLEVLEPAMQRLASQVPPQQIEQMRLNMFERIREDMITKKLLSAAVAASDATVSEEAVNEAIDDIRSSLPEGLDLETHLQSLGMTLEEVTEEIREQLTIREFLDEKTASISEATEAEAKEFYDANPERFEKPENVSASHILILTAEEDTEEEKAAKKEELETIRADIIAGTISFADAASANSDCPSKAQGGSLGTFGKGRMVPEFEAAAFSQEIGEVGEVIQTQFGYHIIQVSEHAEAGKVPFEEVKEQIIAALSNQGKQDAMGEYLGSLRDSATIEIVTP